MPSTLKTISLASTDASSLLDEIADMRIRVFREWPYLYEGSMAYEARYLQTYYDSRRAVFVLAYDGEELVGVSTGIPLSDETLNVQAPFLQRGISLDRFFYFGESMLLPSHRGKGFGVAFFDAREAWARAVGQFHKLCFCAVDRPEDHPMRPQDYIGLHSFWMDRGFLPMQDMSCQMSWQDIGEDNETWKNLGFWSKEIN